MWSLWKFILRHLARAQGFLDPMVVFSNLQHFSKPSEVWVPVELLRSGAVLQARGLINSQAIQNNLDWVWPFWVERQFNPRDKAFVPRAFSLTHINLTHRNWTAVGLPGFSDFPIVDPCGLLTPFFDGWSIDAWIIQDKNVFVPSRMSHVQQQVDLEDTFAVLTHMSSEKFNLSTRTEVRPEKEPACTYDIQAESLHSAFLMVCVRPYNPEGISFIKDISLLEGKDGWLINKKERVYLSQKPSRYIFANYTSGDLISYSAHQTENLKDIFCKVGMATTAAVYELPPGKRMEVTIKVPLSKSGGLSGYQRWNDHMEGTCHLKIPDQRMEFLYNAAIKTIILHSPGDIYPGPFTYKRFWFRDAAFILQAMMAAGVLRNVEKIIDHFPTRQTPMGYFMSQDGEWDSNGQAIWAIKRYVDISAKQIKKEWLHSVMRAAKWIEHKRWRDKNDPLHDGLMPAGFSAEHFGPSDFYYWDDFWSIIGLREAAFLAEKENSALASHLRTQAEDLLHVVEKSLRDSSQRGHHPGLPAAPSRRLDAGSIGSLVASYPLQIFSPNDERVLQTVRFLMDKHFLHGAFYHEISHSGINIYLTLHIAQVLLRAGNEKFFEIVKAVAQLATPTGQWPEAIHPRSGGGCMGDGQHVWACAEWVMMVRNMFVREEESTRSIILCSGIPSEWLIPHQTLSLGPTPTLYGELSLTLKVMETHIHISWKGKWHQPPPHIEIRLPGHGAFVVDENTTSVNINRTEAYV